MSSVVTVARLAARAGAGAVAGIGATSAMNKVFAVGMATHLLGEPPPRKIVRKGLEEMGAKPPKGVALDMAALVAHYGFGASMGALFGLLPAYPRNPVLRGALFGLGVWSASYMGWIPKLGIMPPPRHDKPGRPAVMIAAHLVYGAVLGLKTRRR